MKKSPNGYVEDDENAIGSSIVDAILGEVVGPDMVQLLRPEPDTQSVVQPEPASLLLFLWDLQPFALPDAFDPFVVHLPPRLVQQCGQ